MSSKRRLRRRQCEGKVRHKSKENAVFAAYQHQKKYGGRKKNAYKCQFCKGWHIGTKPMSMRFSPERRELFFNGRR